MTNDMNRNGNANPPPGNSLAVYGQQDALDDFPVLKAFQQYIDTEQSKANRRMMLLCVFFMIVLGIVIAVFTGLLLSVGRRNDSMNERMMEFVLRERAAQQPVSAAPVVVQSSAPDTSREATIRTLTESIALLKRQLEERQASDAPSAVPSAPETPKDDPAARAEEKKVANERERLRAEREFLEKEKERLHQKEIDLQRRKLYPECYGPDGTLLPPGQKTARTPSPSPETARPRPTDAEIDAEIAAIIADGRREEEARAKDEKTKKNAKMSDADFDAFLEGLPAAASTNAAAGKIPSFDWDFPEE